MPRVPTFQPRQLDWSHTSPEISPYSPFTGAALAVGKFAKAIEQRRQEKDMLLLLSKTNDLQERRIQELLNIQDSRLERNALNLTEEEKERINGDYEEFMEGLPENLHNQGARAFYSINAQHLGRIATHELGEMKSWRDTESQRVIVGAEQKAQQVSLGNFEALFRVTGEMRGLLKSDILKNESRAEVSSRALINDTYATWARTDPDVAEQALVKYSSDLQRIMGGDYNKLLASLETGRRIAEQRRESDYRWMIRDRDEHYENTTKAGVTKFLHPKDRLTIDWIVSNEKNMNNSQMRILYSLLRAQDVRAPMNMEDVDFSEYWRLSRLVRGRLDRGHSYETVGQEIADAAERSITGSMAKALMDKLTAEREQTPEQTRAYRLIDKMVFDEQDKNMNEALKAQATYKLDLWIERNPKTDPMQWMESTILKEQKEGLTDYFLQTFGPQLIPGPERALLEESEYPFATMDERQAIDMFYYKHPEVSNDPMTYKRILERLRETQAQPAH